MKRFITLTTSTLALLVFASAQIFAQDDSPGASMPDSSAVARRLSSRNAFERREAAEELARLAATEHRRLVEGYRVQ